MDRLKKAFFFTLIFSEIMLGVFSLAGLIFAPKIIVLFRDDPNVIEIGTTALRMMCIGLLFMPLSTVVEMTCQSVGKKITAAVLAALKAQNLLLLLILPSFCGLWGIQLAQPLSYLLSFIYSLACAAVLFKKIESHTDLQ